MSNQYDEKSQYERMLLTETIMNDMRKNKAMKRKMSGKWTKTPYKVVKTYDWSILAFYFCLGLGISLIIGQFI